MREASPYLGLGMQIAMSMVFFVGGGYLLDRWIETLPWGTIVGAFLGMVAVFVQLVRVTRELNTTSKKTPAEDAGDSPPE